jgi:hypothetical protein
LIFSFCLQETNVKVATTANPKSVFSCLFYKLLREYIYSHIKINEKSSQIKDYYHEITKLVANMHLPLLDFFSNQSSQYLGLLVNKVAPSAIICCTDCVHFTGANCMISFS